ncbi:hypothetical protein PVAP13_1NG387819 [Panicum virgatum]|uniref:Uncharacterized protein n=1 Tax=Panicum virgatum TaxID=38727 RepID=A0A8T0WUI4_PANVG|nr:hypothetical protein PVAP13_1NG387819 [Panicum virgatum]
MAWPAAMAVGGGREETTTTSRRRPRSPLLLFHDVGRRAGGAGPRAELGRPRAHHHAPLFLPHGELEWCRGLICFCCICSVIYCKTHYVYFHELLPRFQMDSYFALILCIGIASHC